MVDYGLAQRKDTERLRLTVDRSPKGFVKASLESSSPRSLYVRLRGRILCKDETLAGEAKGVMLKRGKKENKQSSPKEK